MEAGARPYRLEPLDAGDLTRKVVEDFRQEAAYGGFEIEFVTPDSAATIRGDGEALTQALWNLLDNAVKYSGDSRWVRVETACGSTIRIMVRDRGLGIPAPEQRKILRKFTRGTNAEANGIKGTGIGLAMVRHIVDAHGGTLLVESAPGKGSAFTIELPKEC